MAPRGRPWAPGQSGNPSGRPKTAPVIQELARPHAPEAMETLVRLMRGADKDGFAPQCTLPRLILARRRLLRGQPRARACDRSFAALIVARNSVSSSSLM